MIVKTKRYLAAVVVLVILGGFSYGTYYVDRVAVKTASFVASSLSGMSEDWEYKKHNKYFYGFNDEYMERVFHNYAKLGRFESCPPIIENKIEVSFTNREKVEVKMKCKFEYFGANLLAEITEIDGELFFSEFSFSSEAFLEM